jgi:hypothetical protein
MAILQLYWQIRYFKELYWVVFYIVTGGLCVFKQSFVVNVFCGLYALIGIITILSISPSWHLFLLWFFNVLQWYGKRLSTKIANLGAEALNSVFEVMLLFIF